MPSSPHGPTRWGTYLQVHETRMEQARRTGFVFSDTLIVQPYGGSFLRLEGEIACLGNIVIAVAKNIQILSGTGSDALVRTKHYSYNAHIRGFQTFLRYDNAHAHPGHPDAHHCHQQDWRSGAAINGSPIWVGHDRWPTLGDYIEYVSAWYWENRDDLLAPDAVAALGLRGSNEDDEELALPES